MKRYVQLSVGALSLAFAGIATASAPILHISGAATFRPPITKGIEDILVSTGSNAYTFGYNGSSRYKPNASIYHGFLKSNSQEVYIETYWTGDLSGIVDLTSRNKITEWITSGTTYTLTTAGASIPNSYVTDTSVPPDASSTVSFYTSSAAVVFTSGTAGRAASKTLLNEQHLVDAGSSGKAGGAQALAIAPFQWVLGRLANGFTAPISNIGVQQASGLIENGDLPVSQFTGNSAQQYDYVFLVGRSEDAGARTVPFAEAQNGFTGQNGFGQAPTQYLLTFSGTGQTSQGNGLSTGGTNATVTGLYEWPGNAPLNTEPTINWNTYGHSGYTLTSDLSNALSAINPVNTSSLTFGNASDPNDPTTEPTAASQAYFVGYNGVADTGTLVTNGGLALSYNGVPYSAAAVQTGQYTLWSYAHLYYLTSGSGGLASGSTVRQAADDLADDIYLTDADINNSGAHSSTTGAGIFLNASVLVARPGVEGTPVFQNY